MYELTEHMEEEDEKDFIENKNADITDEDFDLPERKLKANQTITESDCFRLRRMACFGSPKFDRQPALHILSADSRFPDISPGQQLASGNHFLALIPESVMCSIERDKAGTKQKRSMKKGASIRGGGGHSINKRRRRRKRKREFVRSDANGVVIAEKGVTDRLSKDSVTEQGSFFSHKMLKLFKGKRSETPKSISGREERAWEWLINKWIECVLKFMTQVWWTLIYR